MTATRRLAANLLAGAAADPRLIGIDEEGTLDWLRVVRTETSDPKTGQHPGKPAMLAPVAAEAPGSGDAALPADADGAARKAIGSITASGAAAETLRPDDADASSAGSVASNAAPVCPLHSALAVVASPAIAIDPRRLATSSARSGAVVGETRAPAWTPADARAAATPNTTGTTGELSGLWGVGDAAILGRRSQDHMVVTPDGDYHMLINLGGSGGLTMLNASADGGMWQAAFTVADSDGQTTSDIRLLPDGSTLLVVYDNQSSQIEYAQYVYDQTDQSWRLATTSIVYGPIVPGAANPTIALSSQGQLWVSFIVTGSTGLQLFVSISPDNGTTWLTSDTVLPGVSLGSSCVVATPDTTGVLYTTDTAMFWGAFNADNDWTTEQLLSTGNPGIYGSHFCETTFGDDIYVDTADQSGNLKFVSYDGATKTWAAPTTVATNGAYVTNVQISVSDTGDLYIVYDDTIDQTLQVIKSTDGGATWTDVATLPYPINITDTNPDLRFETPGYFSGDLVIMLQVVNPSVPAMHGLYQYVLDVNGAGQPAPRDFNGDGTSDVLWRGSDGNVAIWEMNGLSVAASGLVAFVDLANWTIAGTGDFAGEGHADILWRDSSGDVAIWDMNGFSVVGSSLVGFADPSAWSIAATGDFTGDGADDILWRDTAGDVAVWEMSGSSVIAGGLVGFADPTAWSIKGTGDFDGNGTSDVLWQNTNGSLDIWEMNGTTVAASGPVVGATAAAGWTIRGTGDFNGDGMSDILWQDQSSDVAIWEMNGFSVAASAVVGFADPTAWHIAGVGDYNGDGKFDILWNDTSGDVAVWEMNGFGVAASGLVGVADPARWHIVPPDNTGSIPGTG
jgi:hypothetical protein